MNHIRIITLIYQFYGIIMHQRELQSTKRFTISKFQPIIVYELRLVWLRLF